MLHDMKKRFMLNMLNMWKLTEKHRGVCVFLCTWVCFCMFLCVSVCISLCVCVWVCACSCVEPAWYSVGAFSLSDALPQTHCEHMSSFRREVSDVLFHESVWNICLRVVWDVFTLWPCFFGLHWLVCRGTSLRWRTVKLNSNQD